MTFDQAVAQVSEFIKHYQVWIAPLAGVMAFAESLAFLSLLVPATVLLLATGVVIGQTDIALFPVWLAATIGAYLGDWVSYFVGFHYKEKVGYMWPLNRRPELMARGHDFFERWGIAGVFIGRFFGPLRAVVPLIAGICAMPKLPFQFTNLASAIAWATLMLVPGAFGLPMLFDS